MKPILFLICGVMVGPIHAGLIGPTIVYYGASDASAAAALSNDMFVVADDENNTMRVYKTNGGSQPIAYCDLNPFIVDDPEHREADIEAAASVGNRIYWITSHGRNKDGKMRANRYRFFATSAKVAQNDALITPVGRPCRTLVHQMLKAETTKKLKLDTVTRFEAENLGKKEREKLAPKEHGLNIEGLCAAPDGKTLYIGFRNPLIHDSAADKAIIVPLLNPQQVVDNGAPAEFATPILLDLGGLGIRSIEYSRFHKSYFIIAGPRDDASGFAFYSWSGRKQDRPAPLPVLAAYLKDFTPEAMVVFADSSRLLVLSDDGRVEVDISDDSQCEQGKILKDGKCLNKHLSDQNKKHFRAMWLNP